MNRKIDPFFFTCYLCPSDIIVPCSKIHFTPLNFTSFFSHRLLCSDQYKFESIRHFKAVCVSFQPRPTGTKNMVMLFTNPA